MLSTCVEFIVSNCDNGGDEKRQQKGNDETNRIVELYSNNRTQAVTSSSSSSGKQATETMAVMMRLKQALSDTHSPIVPICAHGLGMITRMMSVRKRHDDDGQVISAVESRYDDVLRALLSQLSHSESYVYLSAVKALCTLADRFTKRTLNVLFDEMNFRSENIRGLGWLSQKLRIVEVLDRIVERLGQTLPPYAPRFVSVLSACATTFPPSATRFDDTAMSKKDYENLVAVSATIRSSSLSTLGMICKTLVLHSIPSLPQLLRLCANASRPVVEPDTRVRRAAACLLYQLVEGRDPDEFMSAVGDLKEVYDILRRTQDVEKDPLARRFAMGAANEIGQITRAYLTPKSKREFHIRVL